MRTWIRLLCAALLVVALPLNAAEEAIGTVAMRYYGTASANDVLLFTSGDIARFDGCMLMSTDGAVDVEGTLDGTNYTTAPLSMQDLGATSVDPVVVTAADRMYYVPGKYKFLRVRQNGATATAASLLCWKA